MNANNAQKLDLLCINTLRTLAIDMVQKANSGHPGTPMGAAPSAYCLWQYFLNFDPADTNWLNRDRFVLSCGHASALLYGLLHLCDVKSKIDEDVQAVSMADIESFRQKGSRCTGHPEYGLTAGVETTTGPLGQGVATSVGMAIAQAWLASTYNRPGFTLFDYRTVVLASDGDMMEGVSSEAASLAGHLQLSRLCWIYDSNHICIEGSTAITFTEDVGTRFEAYGWRVLHVDDGNDLEQIGACLKEFYDSAELPTLIIVQSHIGYGAPHKQDSSQAHGEPLGTEEARLAKEFYGFDPNKQFAVPDGVEAHFFDNFGKRGKDAHEKWNLLFARYREQYPGLAEQIEAMQRKTLPAGWDSALPEFSTDMKGESTRDASGKVLNAIAANVPWLTGGAADLSPSTKTQLMFESSGTFESPDLSEGQGVAGSYAGRNFHFGIREHAMCAAASGMALSGLRSYASSFFVFTDYCRASIRLAAMMGLPVIYIWTHDSIAMGEDGPTHQPIEQLPSMRAIPGMVLLRPADANEVVQAWRIAMQTTQQPVSLVLTRQALPTFDRSRFAGADGVAKGAYVLADAEDGQPDVMLLASGSEVALCIEAWEQLTNEGIKARVVSMPSWDIFEHQDEAYREQVLPEAVHARVSIEAASPFGWERYVGTRGTMISMHSFGLSAPGKTVLEHFGFDAAHVVAAAKEQLARHAPRK